MTPLHCATEKGHIDIVKFIISDIKSKNPFHKDEHINPTSSFENSPLHLAAKYGFIDIVKYFCENLTSAHVVSYYGTTPLHLASANGHVDVVQCLLNHLGMVSNIVSKVTIFGHKQKALPRKNLNNLQLLVHIVHIYVIRSLS